MGTSLSRSRSILRPCASALARRGSGRSRGHRSLCTFRNAGRCPRLRPTLRPADPALVLSGRNGGRRSWSHSSSSDCSCERLRARMRDCASTCSPPRSDACIASPALALALKLCRARRLHHHHHRGAPGPPESVPEHRTHHGVDHLVGRSRLCFRLRRKPVGADQPLANDLRIDRDHLSRDHTAARAFAAICPIRQRSASGRPSSCCSHSPGSSWSIPIRPCRGSSPGSPSPIPS